MESITKYAAFLSDPSEARYHVEKALYLALSGRPGPVLLDVPLDVQGAMIDPTNLRGFSPEEEGVEGPAISPSAETVADLIKQIAAARRPVIYFGHGVRCAGGQQSVMGFIDTLGIPVVTTPMAKDLIPHHHKHFVGHPGIKGDRAANFAVQAADVLICVGVSLKPQNTGYEIDQFAPNAVKIHVDPDIHVLNHGSRMCQQQIQSDSRLFLESMQSALIAQQWNSEPYQEWRQRTQDWKMRFPSEKENHVRLDDSSPLNAYEFVHALGKKLPQNTTVVTDAGQPFYILPQGWQLLAGQRYIINGSFAGMGYALPAATGVSTSHEGDDHITVAVIGDGSLQTNIHELQTIRHHNLNVKMFVIDNGGYVSIRSTQQRFFDGFLVGSSDSSGVTLPPLDRIAAAYGIPFINCVDRTSLDRSISEVFETPGPVICQVRCLQMQDVIPGVPSMRMPNGKMKSRPLHEMAPLLSDDELRTVFPFQDQA